MYAPLDESSAAARELTYKPFHHLFDPAGKQLVTKGAGGKYTHHRGLFYGFNRITYGSGQSTDVWHCTNGAHQSHQQTVLLEAGPVAARHRAAIRWHGQKKEAFADEVRELTFYHVPGGTLVEFASRLQSADGRKVRLDGDPQHSGFHFRAAGEVADKTSGQTYFLRPDGKGAPRDTRNWDAKGRDPRTVNLPWDAMSYVVGKERYTMLYVDHPANPKESRGSERDYGRIGSYFEFEIADKQTLDVRYRVWLQSGEMNAADAARIAHDFASPAGVAVAVK
jgi:hypothetical protein